MTNAQPISDKSGAKAFEPEIVFPSHPYEAAFINFAVMAYPEAGAGQPGNPGSKYATALSQFAFWATSKAKGLPYIRKERNDPQFVAPQRRTFEGTLNRGRARLDRRIAAYDLFGTQLLQGFFDACAIGSKALRDGRADEAFHIHPQG